MQHDKTSHAAKGRWRGILGHYGIPAQLLDGKQHPCPLCVGKDRWRFDDMEGRGTSICNQCGARDGVKLVLDLTGRGIAQVLSEIDGLVGNIAADGPKPKDDPAKHQNYLREVYLGSKPVVEGDLAHKYLASRGVAEMIYPDALRFAPKLRDGDGGIRPCLVAMVGVHGDLKENGQQRYATMHRTFLRPDGLAKAEMERPRKIMPGTVPPGACVMLSEWPGYGTIGIAEGIETAMSASMMFGIPVWSALTAGGVAKWIPPVGAEEVVIFADNDDNFTGQRAAYTLANSIKANKATADIKVNVQTPEEIGKDWADMWSLSLASRR